MTLQTAAVPGAAVAATVGATLTFETEPGHGTTFHVRLPVGDLEEAA